MLAPDIMDTAFAPVRERIRRTTVEGVRYFAHALPKAGKIDGQVVIAFDYLNPRVIGALARLDTKVFGKLAHDTRETVRAVISDGLRDQVGPAKIAKQLRAHIGLGATQVQEVANYRAALASGQPGRVFSYRARDRRFDASVRKGALSADQIDRAVEAYTRRRIAINAQTTAATATRDSLKIAQRMTWEDARDKGVLDESDRLMRRWSTVLDGRERPEHHRMHGETVPADQPYSNGDTYAGEGDPWNCRCIDVFFVARG